MVRALLGGSKTQTRRIVKPCKDRNIGCQLAPNEIAGEVNAGEYSNCPYGKPGDQFWVREAFSGPYCMERSDEYPAMPPGQWPKESPIWYWADGDPKHGDWTRPRPSIHMPRWVSRITLEIVSVRVERLQDISEADCRAEGAAGGHGAIPGYGYSATPKEHYRHVWESINGPGSWDANPWVWAVEFRRLP